MSRYAVYGVQEEGGGNTVTRARFFPGLHFRGTSILRKEQEL